MTVIRQVDDLVERLRQGGCVFAEDEAALLIEAADDDAHLDVLVARRLAGEPLEQIVGWAEFMGLRLVVSPGVFVPRRRTELLARTALDLLPAGGRLLDLCCGVAPVAAVVARDRPDVELTVSDLDSAAVACASANVPTAATYVGDLFPTASTGRFDVIAANAPYVPSDEIALMPSEARDHERHAALDGGVDGVEMHRRIAAAARDHLTADGVVVIETGRHQAHLTADAFEGHGFSTQVVADDDFAATVVVVRVAQT